MLDHNYSNERYIVKSPYTGMEETLNCIAYIQAENAKACKNFEISVKEVCELLCKYFSFEMDNKNYYGIPKFKWRHKIGKIKEINYTNVGLLKINKKNVYLIELTAFWELYHVNRLPKAVQDNPNIGNEIQNMVRNLTNAQLWL